MADSGKRATYHFISNDGYVPGNSSLTYKKIFAGYVENATIHGLGRIYSSVGTLKKIFWCISVIGVIIGMAYNIIDVTLTYLKYEKEVNIEIHQQSELQFPAVTICNMSPVRSSALSNYKEAKRRKKRATVGDNECPADTADNGDGRCYKIEDGLFKINVAESAEKCQNVGPHFYLATSPTQQHHANISAVLGAGSTKTWLGLYNKNSTWTWIDGNAVTWTNWAPGEPAGDGTCAYLQYGQWYDAWCGDTADQGMCMRYKYKTERDAITITDDMSAIQTLVPLPNSCCCTCCFTYGTSLMDNSCNTCTASSVEGASQCASEIASPSPAPTPAPAVSTTPTASTTTVPPTVPGSKFPERVATREDFTQAEVFAEELASVPEADMKSLGTQASDFILDCQYEGINCNMNDFYQFQNPTHGNCYIFNSGWGSTAVLRRSRQAGRRHGLFLVVNIEQDEYVKEIGDMAGIRVVIHQQTRMPFPEDEGLNVAPGHGTSIAMRQVTVNRLGSQYGNCTDPGLGNSSRNVYEELYPVEYSVPACQKTCLQDRIVQTCNCKDPYLPLLGRFGDIATCSLSDIEQDDCRYNIRTQYNDREIICDCPTSCSDTTFSYALSTTIWPSDIQKEATLEKFKAKIPTLLNDPNDQDKFQRNLLKAEIYFEEFNYEVIQEKPSFLSGSFISNLGGLIGLFVGCSIVSLFEILEYLVDSMVFFCLKKKFRKINNEQGCALKPRTDSPLSAQGISYDMSGGNTPKRGTPPPSYFSYLNGRDAFMDQVNDYLSQRDPDGRKLHQKQTNHGRSPKRGRKGGSVPEVDF